MRLRAIETKRQRINKINDKTAFIVGVIVFIVSSVKFYQYGENETWVALINNLLLAPSILTILSMLIIELVFIFYRETFC